jgi:branched-chain amino acid transport system ATP-binding protein
MVAIGRSLMSDPALRLLDEPSLGLALLAIEDVIRALVALRERGRSLLISLGTSDWGDPVSDEDYATAAG